MSPIRSFAIVCSLVAPLAVAACGGGGGGGGTGGGGGGGGGVIPTPTPPPSTTNSSGTVVDDTSGSPLAGIRVALRPWTACTTPTPTSVSCPTPLPAPQATTAANGTFTLSGAPNGHYFLVIGDDTPGSNTTTVHANVTLSGGTVALVAPTMPPIPTITPHPWESNGDYRIQTLDAVTMQPCFTEFNLQRVGHLLPQVVADEWLLENIRDVTRYQQSGWFANPPWVGNANGGLSDTYDGLVGGSTCPALADSPFTVPGSAAFNPLTIWYGAYYVNAVSGNQQEQADPATLASAKGVIWP